MARPFARALLLAGALWPAAVQAGPPFLTDDPEPTQAGHWEIYAPLVEAEGSGSESEGSVGAEINYGAASDLQLTVGLPVAYTHDASGWRAGAGDLEASAKYRFYKNERAGLQIAAFPGITLPTASRGMGNHHVTALLPIWAQQDLGQWSIFGGGGYAINPGRGNRNYWTGGLAVTRKFGDKLLFGLEADRQGRDSVTGRVSTSLSLGTIYDLPGPLRLLASGGPTFHDDGSRGFHAFAAVGIDF